jgi:hypothetical protein
LHDDDKEEDVDNDTAVVCVRSIDRCLEIRYWYCQIGPNEMERSRSERCSILDAESQEE